MKTTLFPIFGALLLVFSSVICQADVTSDKGTLRLYLPQGLAPFSYEVDG